jgi:hypothetical protein
MARTRLNLLPALLAVLLGAAVAVAANGRTWSNHAGQTGWSTRTFALIAIAGVGLVALLLARTVWGHRSSRLTWPLAVATLGPVVLLTLALTVAALLWHRVTGCTSCTIRTQGSSYGGSAPAGQSPNHGASLGLRKPHSLNAVHNHNHPTSLFLLWLALGVLIVATAIWIWRRRPVASALTVWRERRTHQQQANVPPDVVEPAIDEADRAETATRYIESSLDDLRREPDLRRTIIACYARMEQLLAHIGTPREQWETPLEFLRRTDADAGQPLDRLTRLYEEAQFSPHPLDERRRLEAITALTSLRDQLRPTPA